MNRPILTFLALISLLLGVSASVGSQTAPAQADTTIPVYGCPANLGGSPIGGGVDYLNIIDPSEADYVVSTAAQLKSALTSATSGQIVYIADGATISLDSTWNDMMESLHAFVVPAGVTLAAGRGIPGITGGRIKVYASFSKSTSGARLIRLHDSSRVTGVEIEGVSGVWGNPYTMAGIWIPGGGNNIEIDNCYIHNIGSYGIFGEYVTNLWVHHNNIQHCVADWGGYAVSVAAYDIYHYASAIIEGNYFTYEGHMFAGGRGNMDIVFRYNLCDGWNHAQAFDLHGNNDDGMGAKDSSGEYIYPTCHVVEIYNNTCQIYTDSYPSGYRFIKARGTPMSTGYVRVYNNWATWTNDDVISEEMDTLPDHMYDAHYPDGPWVRWYGNPETGQSMGDSNWLGTAPPPTTNVAPVLNAIGNKSIKEGATLSFTISGSDANGDALTYSASNLPVGATFNSTNRTFSWTPSLSQAGVYASVHFQVSDGQMTDYEDVTITVIDEVAPVLNAIGDKGINWGATLSFTISGSDANGDALTYSASNLPVGATFDPATQTFSWTPEDSQAGVYASIRFQVSDGSLSDTEDITITVGGGVLADVNSDGAVNSLDMIRVGQHWNETGESGWIPEDINKDGTVNVLDATLVGQHWTG